jgi:hypothetical protein
MGKMVRRFLRAEEKRVLKRGLLAIYRGGTRRRLGACFAHISRALAGVVGCCGKGIRHHAFRGGSFKQFFQEGTTPTTTGAGSKAFAQLCHSLRFFDANEVHHLALGDMKAKAQFVVGLHRVAIFIRGTPKSTTGGRICRRQVVGLDVEVIRK